jgi:hypothetical protein
MPALDRIALEAACRRVSQGTISIADTPENLDDIVTTQEIEELIEGYMHFATAMAESVELNGGDPNLIIRLVDYMAYRVAIPAFGQDVLWFRNCLGVLAELASPGMWGMPPAYYPALDDFAQGIAVSRSMRKT